MFNNIEDKFVSLANPSGLGCWNWTGPKDKDGYGIIYWKGAVIKAHRFSFEYYMEQSAEKLCVCHSCDNPSCVNPAHLWLGTTTDNNLDRHTKGRSRNKPSKGEDHNMVKLTEDNVLAIKADTRILKKIALDYSISQAQVSRIKNNKTWTHLRMQDWSQHEGHAPH